MAKKFLTHLNLAQNELQNTVIQRLGSDPGSPVEGQIYYNTATDRIRTYNGASWVEYGTGGGGGDVTQASASGASGRVKVSAGADKSIADYGGTAGLLKTTDANGTLATATVGTDYVTGSSTNTFTNKSIDANGTGNSITNLETADFAANVVDNDSTLAANSASRLATQQAVKGYVDNAVNGLNWKDSVRVATTANGTLATAFANAQTVDGVTLATNDRILIKDQTTQTENGIYVVQASGAPVRATDADTAGEIKQATVVVEEGTVNADSTWTLTNNGTITLGSTNLTFALQGTGATPDATTTVKGKVELADATEAEARSSGTLAVTPLSLANFPVKKVFTIGDGSATSIAVTHSLGNKDVITQVREVTGDAVVECDIVNTSTTVTTLSFTTAPASNSIRVVVMG